MKVTISNQWNDYLKRFPQGAVDIYYTEEYVKLYQSVTEQAYCIICEEENKIALMPFLRRNVGEFYDFETAYGYGGPAFNDNSAEWIHASLRAMKEFFSKQGYLCGFMRFHPLLHNAEKCNENIEVLYDRKTIMIDLQPSCEVIWKDQITSKNRNMIRKAEKNGLQYVVENDYVSLNEFEALYSTTMQRLSAESFYYFKDSYYDAFKNSIGANGFLGTVRLDGKIIGAALFMYYEGYGHYHLAGSDRAYSSLGVNNYLLWNTAKELKERGVTCFHLGGGTTSDSEDSLFKFKKAFSPNEKDFYIGKWIFNQQEYEKICNEWERENPELIGVFGKRLLKYRYTKEDL